MNRTQLTILRIDSAIDLDDAYSVLCTRQSNLRNMRWHSSSFAAACRPAVRPPATVTTLQVLLKSERQVVDLKNILDQVPAVRHLEIVNAPKRDEFDAAQQAASSQALLHALLGRAEDQERLTLRSLHLGNFHLVSSSGVIAHAVGLQHLVALALEDCEGITGFVKGLVTNQEEAVNLRSLVLTNKDDFLDTEISEDLDHFLISFKGLRNLLIYAPQTPGMAPSLVEAVGNHGETLESLYLDCCWDDDDDIQEIGLEPHFDRSRLGKCLEGCKKLEQLAINGPIFDLGNEEGYACLEMSWLCVSRPVLTT